MNEHSVVAAVAIYEQMSGAFGTREHKKLRKRFRKFSVDVREAARAVAQFKQCMARSNTPMTKPSLQFRPTQHQQRVYDVIGASVCWKDGAGSVVGKL